MYWKTKIFMWLTLLLWSGMEPTVSLKYAILDLTRLTFSWQLLKLGDGSIKFHYVILSIFAMPEFFHENQKSLRETLWLVSQCLMHPQHEMGAHEWVKEGGKAWILCISLYPCVPSLYNIKRTSRERIEDPDKSRKTETVYVYVQAVDEQNKNES